MKTEELSKKIVDTIINKKAENIISIDVENKNSYTDEILICTGSSSLHIKALAETVLDFAKENRVEILSKEGFEAGVWILIDFGTIILHIFKQNIRQNFNLEQLWQERDAKIKHIESAYAKEDN
ncbi:MAG: ribosome silencing factor [Candidatus Cloacimonadota bacterium]|nr:ribosome silencing factor [Candidatus Cloacimonadota bacterium]